MKKLLIVMGVVSVGFLTTQAKEVVQIQEKTAIVMSDTTQQDSIKRTKIQLNELPEAIKTTLQGENFQGWTVVSAFLVEQKDVNPFFEITMKRDDEEEIKIFKLTPEGKIIE